MNKKIKPTVYKILRTDKMAREDDNYLIFKVVSELIPIYRGETFVKVLAGMKHKGISFEAITRARRKFFEEYPEFKIADVEAARRKEEENYIIEYGNHIPNIL